MAVGKHSLIRRRRHAVVLDDVEAAHELLEPRMGAVARLSLPDVVLNAFSTLSRCRWRLGRQAQAFESIDRLESYANRYGLGRVLAQSLALRLRGHLLRDETDAALAVMRRLEQLALASGASGSAARRMGDDVTMHIALLLTSVFVITANRFLPGSIDHHNVQLVAVAAIAAGLLDPARGTAGHALAGLAAAAAIAIGAETTPLIAAACAIVGVLWALEGAAYAKAARAFSLTLLVSLSAFFFATVPPAQYATVTCDSLSVGFYAVVGIGAAALFIATRPES